MGRQEERRLGKGSRTKPVELLQPVFVQMTAEEEKRAIEALAELLAPLFLNEPAPEREATE
jgi:hypothetical protein